jgi:hypothetical protein
VSETNRIPKWRVLLVGQSLGAGIKSFLPELSILQNQRSTIDTNFHECVNQIINVYELEVADNIVIPHASSGKSNIIYERLLSSAEMMAPSIGKIISHHMLVPGSEAIIITGDCILPDLYNTERLSIYIKHKELDLADNIRTVFIYEKDKNSIQRNLSSRIDEFSQLSPRHQGLIVEEVWNINAVIKSQAIGLGYPLVIPKPQDLLLEEVLKSIR